MWSSSPPILNSTSEKLTAFIVWKLTQFKKIDIRLRPKNCEVHCMVRNGQDHNEDVDGDDEEDDERDVDKDDVNDNDVNEEEDVNDEHDEDDDDYDDLQVSQLQCRRGLCDDVACLQSMMVI